MSNTEKTRTIFQWTLKHPEKVYAEKCLQETDLKVLNEIDIRITEKNITIVKKFFTSAAFDQLKLLKRQRKINGIWICQCCKENIENLPSVRCDRCLHWFHLSCTDKSHEENSV